MPDFFWDTSALVKHYHPEPGTSKVDKLLQEPGARHAVSRLAVTETFSVFAGKVRSGLITLIEFDQLCRRFLADTRGKPVLGCSFACRSSPGSGKAAALVRPASRPRAAHAR